MIELDFAMSAAEVLKHAPEFVAVYSTIVLQEALTFVKWSGYYGVAVLSATVSMLLYITGRLARLKAVARTPMGQFEKVPMHMIRKDIPNSDNLLRRALHMADSIASNFQEHVHIRRHGIIPAAGKQLEVYYLPGIKHYAMVLQSPKGEYFALFHRFSSNFRTLVGLNDRNGKRFMKRELMVVSLGKGEDWYTKLETVARVRREYFVTKHTAHCLQLPTSDPHTFGTTNVIARIAEGEGKGKYSVIPDYDPTPDYNPASSRNSVRKYPGKIQSFPTFAEAFQHAREFTQLLAENAVRDNKHPWDILGSKPTAVQNTLDKLHAVVTRAKNVRESTEEALQSLASGDARRNVKQVIRDFGKNTLDLVIGKSYLRTFNARVGSKLSRISKPYTYMGERTRYTTFGKLGECLKKGWKTVDFPLTAKSLHIIDVSDEKIRHEVDRLDGAFANACGPAHHYVSFSKNTGVLELVSPDHQSIITSDPTTSGAYIIKYHDGRKPVLIGDYSSVAEPFVEAGCRMTTYKSAPHLQAVTHT